MRRSSSARRIRRGLCSSATALAIGLALGPAPAHAQKDGDVDFWHRDTLTGDWGGLRDELADQGSTFTNLRRG